MGLIRLLSIVALICPVAFGKEDTLRVFKCANGNQVQKAWLCDGEDDCGDNSDENNPECNSKVPCTAQQFRCRDNGRCIPLSLTCDREPDCSDKSDEDEKMCHTTDCFPDQFKCDDKECIPHSWLCDGKADCKNGLDEANCKKNCTAKEFSCGDGNCIDILWKCDGDFDCENGRDEEGCPKKSRCDPNLDFECSEGNCIPLKFLCDGDFDCKDRSDEKNCTQNQYSHGLKICNDNQFECPDKKTCIHETWLCDQQWDCPDGADESPEYCTNTCSVGMFECSNKQCVPDSAKCDGVSDCFDGSDEENCSILGGTHCASNEIDCGSGTCLPMEKACNGVRECANGADEGPMCGINECEQANGGCDHKCVDQPLGFHCKCHEGYRLVGNKTCVDINECSDIYGSCSQTCTNTEGSFTCSCHKGYTKDPEDPTRCKADVKNSYLIFTKREDIRKLSLGDDEQLSVIINDTKLSAALDFHYEAQEIYWSDVSDTSDMSELKYKIYRADVDGLTPKKVLINDGIGNVESIAVDWIHGNIYWTDTGKKTIEVSSLNGLNRKTLVSSGLEEPRALVVDPVEGWMYWTDWGKNARIERVGLDGSNRHRIVTHNIRWPNGLALEFDSKKIYWVDAKLNAIYSANYDGSGRRLVIKSSEYLHHPYSVTVFEDHVYWSDWDTQMIYRADKLDGRRPTPLRGEPRTLQNPMVLKVYHPYRQARAENRCATAGCSHLCLPTPKLFGRASSSVVCACPDGMSLADDRKTCGLPSTKIPPPSSHPETPEMALPPGKSPPIYIDFVPPEDPSLVDQAREINWLLVLVIILTGSFLTTCVLVSVCACAYKVYLHGNFKIMNFENPIYRKTPTQDPLCVVDSSEPSEQSSPGDEAREPFCPV